MQVLFANLFWDAAGCSGLQCRAVNRHTGWDARHFRGVKTFYGIPDMGAEKYCRDELVAVIEAADVVEFGSAEHQRQAEAEARIQNDVPGFRYGFDWGEITKNKVRIYHDYNSFPGQWRERAADKAVWTRKGDVGYDAIFSSIPQAVHIYKDCEYVPDIVPEYAEEYAPCLNRGFGEVVLGHYPTGGGNNKNTDELKRALAIEPVRADVTEKTIFYNELLERKHKINLGFDAIWRGFHGMTGVENLALGIPTMCGIDDCFYPVFKDFHETDFEPFDAVADVAGVVATIRKYKNDLGLLDNRCSAVRGFMESVWSFAGVAQKIVKKYERILG